jgi:outer membrane protein insertion porin family
VKSIRSIFKIKPILPISRIFWGDFHQISKRFLKLSLLAASLSGCLGTHYLKNGEKLLYRQRIKAPKHFSTEPLSLLYVQKTNRKIPLLPINSLVWMYYAGVRHFHPQKKIAKRDSLDKKFQRKINAATSPGKKSNLQYRKQKRIDALNVKINTGNNLMQWGEKASVFDTTNIKNTLSRFDTYLFSKGYFLAKTSYTITEFKKRVDVTYLIEPGTPYRYDTISHDIADTVVRKLFERTSAASLIRKGDQFDQDKIGKERERIDLLLKNHGYYDFSRQYINFDIDTAYRHPHKIALRMDILNPARHDYHKQFRVDSITFTTDAAVVTGDRIKRRSRVYHDITFRFFNDRYSTKILSQRVFIRKDSLYSRSATIDTQRQLANLDAFKFVNINYDTSGGRFIANIFSSPMDRYSWSNEAGMTVTQGFPGPYYTMSFKKRNLFGGLESFDINGRFGFEGVASATEQGNFYKSTQASVNGILTFPQFLFPLGQSAGYRLGKYNPKTRLLGGYTYTDRPEYQRSITTLSNTYTWENKKTIQYAFTLTSLSIIHSKKDSAFTALLDTLQKQGNNLINSFKPSFVSSMIFSVTWNPNNYGNNQKSSFYMRTQLESGGTLFNLYSPKFATKQGLEVYKFLRFSLDMRKNIVIDKNTVLAYRFNSGIAYSYGGNHALPYEKYFFVGGSNSVRAWRPRRLGVGSYPVLLSGDPSKDGRFNYQFEKPGEILLESSVELRQKLFGFVSGAVFIDAGNVWTFKQQDPETGPGYPTYTGNTQFRFTQFYKEIGIGTGFGLRFDFSFLVLRLDVGMKVYDPAREEGDRFVLTRVKFWSPYGSTREPVIYNVGIGYPF